MKIEGSTQRYLDSRKVQLLWGLIENQCLDQEGERANIPVGYIVAHTVSATPQKARVRFAACGVEVVRAWRIEELHDVLG